MYSIKLSNPGAGYQKLNPSTETEGEAWCVYSSDPLSLEKRP
jgi:hypothetical protein